MEIHLGKNVKYINKFFRFSPQNCFEKPEAFFISYFPIPMILTVSQLPALIYIINYLANEKKNRFFDYLKIIKINSVVYISMNRMMDLFISILNMFPVLVLFKYYNLVNYTSYFILTFYIMITTFATNSLFCLISNQFKDQSFGMIVAIIFMIFSLFVSMPIRRCIFLPNKAINYVLVKLILYRLYFFSYHCVDFSIR